MNAISSLKISAEELEMVNLNLSREIVSTKQKYEWQLNLSRLRQERADLLYNALYDENQKLFGKLQDKDGNAYELIRYYQELVKEIEYEKEMLHKENYTLKKELMDIQKRAGEELERLGQAIKNVHQERDSLEREYKEQLEIEQSKIRDTRNVNAKLQKQIEDLAETVNRQMDEISHIDNTIKSLEEMEAGETKRSNKKDSRKNSDLKDRVQPNSSQVRNSLDFFFFFFFL